MVVKVGDKIATEFANPGVVLFIGKEWIVYTNGKTEFCSHRDDCNFWIPAEIEWQESLTTAST